MNSYYDDDPPYRPQGQAPVPGPGGYDPNAYDPNAYEPNPYEAAAPGEFDPFAAPGADPYAAPPPPPATPPSPAGRAQVGRASVRPAGYDDMHEGFDPFSSDNPVPAFDPFAPEQPPPMPGQPVGRASVSPVSGRATVGRASVGVPGGPGGPDGPRGPGGPGRPGGPTGPGGRPDGAKGKPLVNKKRRRRNRILAAFATLIMLTGILVISVTYYAASIPTPASIQLNQSTVIEYSNGKPMAQIGTYARTLVPLSTVPKPVRDAVVATEDSTFYSNSGVDFKGIARALVNNVTGGSQQGASTITQQYARTVVAGVGQSDTYSRKLKEAVIAVKLTQHYSKDYILGAYLNSVPFGRGAYGIQAAARAYFNKDAANLTQAEGIVLADLIKDPNGNKYDPACKCLSAQQRFQYSRDQLLKANFITQAQYDALKYPITWIQPKNTAANQNMTTPEGFIVHHVMSELSALKGPNGQPLFPLSGPDSLLDGGYTIKTTINQAAQHAAEMAADPAIGGSTSPFKGVYGRDQKGKKTSAVADALVAVEPGTGRVLAYYGGPNGANIDFAGIYNDPVMASGGWTGQHVTPGSTFKTITMATALSKGISIDSLWWGPTKRTFTGYDGRTAPVTNISADACPGPGNICPMWQALQHSTNTVYYAIGKTVHPDKIVDMAQSLGINHIWAGAECAGKRIDLTPNSGSTVFPKCVGGEVAFGQFGVAVQDVANVMATFANHGLKADEHFVQSVTRGFDKTPVNGAGERINVTKTALNPEMADDEAWAMQQVFTNNDERNNQLDGDREAAVKTGTWQLGWDASKSQEAMFSGYTAGDREQGQIAASVWVGYSKDPVAMYTSSGSGLGGSKTPAAIWKTFIDLYEKGKPLEKFAPAAKTGDPLAGETTRPTAPPSTPPPTNPGNPGNPGCQGICLPGGGPSTQNPPPSGPLSGSVNVNGHTANLTWDNSGSGGNGRVKIDWGDGSSQPGSRTGSAGHLYNPGNYTITVTDQGDQSRVYTVQVTINN